MGNKTKTARFIRELRIVEHAPAKRVAGKPHGLYLLELRSHVTEDFSPKRKLLIKIDPHIGDEGLPTPIKITHT